MKDGMTHTPLRRFSRADPPQVFASSFMTENNWLGEKRDR
jgi:hypothetical protein